MSLGKSAAGPRAIFVRSRRFSASHRYSDQSFTEVENRATYGILTTKKTYGFNFVVEAHVEGSVDPVTGMVVNLVDLDRWMSVALSKLDHQHLNDLSIFNGHAPTPERIAEWIFAQVDELVRTQAPHAKLRKIRVAEGSPTSAAAAWADALA